MTAPELLAPARNYECGKAAIDSGADAVYVAGPAFGAREAAGNDIREVERLVKYGYRYGVKTYLTLNTLLYPHEYETARRLAFQAWEAGCSALIIQDPGVLETDLPPIPLFASTQMNNRSLEQIRRLEQAGFVRAILARELSLAQIAEIRKQTSIELESFVHGALCVCYSGQCYLSELITGRSANRGACMQACRNRYDLEDHSGRVLVRDQHLLSLHDLRLDHYLKELADAGISSFKIEGRLKNISYIKNCVGHYRSCLDAMREQSGRDPSAPGYQKASLGRTELSFCPDPERSFSRGYTDYYLTGKRSSWATMLYGKARGEEIGTIVSSGKQFSVLLRNTVKLQTGDGICYIDDRGALTGSVVNSIKPGRQPGQYLVALQSGEPVRKESNLYRNYDRLFEKELAQQGSVKRVVDVALRLIIGPSSVSLEARIPAGPEVTLCVPCVGTPAEQPEQANRQIRKQLEKSAEGLYLFHVESLLNHPAQFFPAAQINEWRRSLGRKLLEASQTYFRPQPSPVPAAANETGTTAQRKEALQALRQHIPPAGTIPQTLMQCKYCIKYQLGWCGKTLPNEPLWLVNQGKRFRLEFDCIHCEMSLLKE